jgi:hypothetical protein
MSIEAFILFYILYIYINIKTIENEFFINFSFFLMRLYLNFLFLIGLYQNAHFYVTFNRLFNFKEAQIQALVFFKSKNK